MISATSKQSLIFAGLALFLVGVTATLGSSVTTPQIPGWYAGLKKPWFNPPNLAFPIAWTTLFALMAFGLWRILRAVDAGKPRKLAILTFLTQLLFNAGWSFAFFGAQSPAAGLFVIAGLVLSVLAMILAFRKVDPLAANLQIPYLCWVSFASILNIAIWRLN
jgi:translocator protein